MTTATLIRRTYNVHGDHDFLIRMEGKCPVWCGDRSQALRLTQQEASSTVALIATYRDWMCPNGIKGVEAIAA